MQYQILQTNIKRTKWQTARGITNEILGAEGLKGVDFVWGGVLRVRLFLLSGFGISFFLIFFNAFFIILDLSRVFLSIA